MVQNTTGNSKLDKSFFLSDDVVQVARDLLGKRLLTLQNGALTSGIIIETEAYRGVTDKASHAYGGRRTKRTGIMYHEGGCIYVYLCYGIHSLFNIVTNKAGIPDAVLIRGLIPEKGLDEMMGRRNTANKRILTDGPGKLSQAMAIHHSYSGIELGSKLNGFSVWIEQGYTDISGLITSGPRIGVDYAGDDALLPWRFKLKKLTFQ